MKMTKERFISRLEKLPNGCWLWVFAKTKAGYGLMTVDYKQHYAHRMAWELFRGPIPEGCLVCHNCPSGDNRACCNPDHLFIGTCKDNIQDAVKKGMFSKQAETFRRLWREKWSRVGHPCRKLTEEQVTEMRRLHREEKWGYRRLSRHFKIGFATAQGIIQRWSWKNIP